MELYCMALSLRLYVETRMPTNEAYVEIFETWISSSVVANVPVFILCPVQFTETCFNICDISTSLFQTHLA